MNKTNCLDSSVYSNTRMYAFWCFVCYEHEHMIIDADKWWDQIPVACREEDRKRFSWTCTDHSVRVGRHLQWNGVVN